MAKKKKQFYKDLEFDDVQYAIDIVDEYRAKLKRAEVGLFVSVCVSLINIFVFNMIPKANGNYLLACLGISGMIGSIVAYIVGGGISTALRWAWKIAVFGWVIIPFPFDIVTGLCCLMAAIAIFFFVPVVCVYMNYRQINLEYKAAKKYISYYKVKIQATQSQKQEIGTKGYTSTSKEQVGRIGTYANPQRSQVSGTRTYSSPSRGQASGTRTYSSSSRSQSNRTRV